MQLRLLGDFYSQLENTYRTYESEIKRLHNMKDAVISDRGDNYRYKYAN